MTYWKWTCEKPPDKPDEKDQPEKPKEKQSVSELILPPFLNHEDKIMEWLLWTIYLSGIAWGFGFPIILLLGLPIYFWITLQEFLKLFSGEGTFVEWLSGPLLRIIIGWLIFIMHIYGTLVPGLNFITSFVFGWWANLDYYYYNYELFAGPTVPEPK